MGKRRVKQIKCDQRDITKAEGIARDQQMIRAAPRQDTLRRRFHRGDPNTSPRGESLQAGLKLGEILQVGKFPQLNGPGGLNWHPFGERRRFKLVGALSQ